LREATIGADVELHVIVFDLAARISLREDHIELIVERAVADKVVEATISVIDLDAVNNRRTGVDKACHCGERVALAQPRTLDMISNALTHLLMFTCQQHHVLGLRMITLSVGERTTTRWIGDRRMTRWIAGRMMGALFIGSPRPSCGCY
jgi:hypothetical protein